MHLMRLMVLQAVWRYMQDAQAARACLGLLRQLANSDSIKESIVGASGFELINQAVACHLASAGAGGFTPWQAMRGLSPCLTGAGTG